MHNSAEMQNPPQYRTGPKKREAPRNPPPPKEPSGKEEAQETPRPPAPSPGAPYGPPRVPNRDKAYEEAVSESGEVLFGGKQPGEGDAGSSSSTSKKLNRRKNAYDNIVSNAESYMDYAKTRFQGKIDAMKLAVMEVRTGRAKVANPKEFIDGMLRKISMTQEATNNLESQMRSAINFAKSQSQKFGILSQFMTSMDQGEIRELVKTYSGSAQELQNQFRDELETVSSVSQSFHEGFSEASGALARMAEEAEGNAQNVAKFHSALQFASSIYDSIREIHLVAETLATEQAVQDESSAERVESMVASIPVDELADALKASLSTTDMKAKVEALRQLQKQLRSIQVDAKQTQKAMDKEAKARKDYEDKVPRRIVDNISGTLMEELMKASAERAQLRADVVSQMTGLKETRSPKMPKFPESGGASEQRKYLLTSSLKKWQLGSNPFPDAFRFEAARTGHLFPSKMRRKEFNSMASLYLDNVASFDAFFSKVMSTGIMTYVDQQQRSGNYKKSYLDFKVQPGKVKESSPDVGNWNTVPESNLEEALKLYGHVVESTPDEQHWKLNIHNDGVTITRNIRGELQYTTLDQLSSQTKAMLLRKIPVAIHGKRTVTRKK